MEKKKFLIKNENIRDFLASKEFHILILIVGFAVLITTRITLKTFGGSLGYLYVTLISLAGFWFGLRGGMLAATLATAIFFSEISFMKGLPYREMVVQGTYIRIGVYFLIAAIMGYLFEIERRLKKDLHNLAYYDELTGCVNFRWAMQLLETEIDRSKRYNKNFAISLLDIDHFKKINDTYNHIVGNDILKAFANILKANVRAVDIVARYGGEEFLLIFPEATVEQAVMALERIKDKLSSVCIYSPHLQEEIKTPIKFSAGVSCFGGGRKDLDTLLSVADEALYRAKKSGRNQIKVDERKSVRTAPQTNLKAELVKSDKGDSLSAMEVSNISKEGTLLIFPEDVAFGDFLCRLHFPEEAFPAILKCKVVHKEKDKDNSCRVGVNFLNMSPKIEKMLYRYMNRDASIKRQHFHVKRPL